jgi:hypothetical protein
VIRLNSKGVPSKAMAGGKNSAIEGMCGPPSSPEAASSAIVAAVDRVHAPGLVWRSVVGAPRAGAPPFQASPDRWES